MANLPPGALRERRKLSIRRNLAVLTDGKVGFRLKVHTPKAAKQRALKSLKRIAWLMRADPAAQEGGKAAWHQFLKALEFLLSPLK